VLFEPDGYLADAQPHPLPQRHRLWQAQRAPQVHGWGAPPAQPHDVFWQAQAVSLFFSMFVLLLVGTLDCVL
jgi:hypothetical protein